MLTYNVYSKRFSRQKIQKDPMQSLGLLFFYVQHLRRLVISNLCKTYVMIFSCPLHPIMLYIYQNNVCKHGLCLQAWDSIKLIVILPVKSVSIPLCLLLNPLRPVTTMAYMTVIRVLHRCLSLAFEVCPSLSFVLLFQLPLSVAMI